MANAIYIQFFNCSLRVETVYIPIDVKGVNCRAKVRSFSVIHCS